MHREYQSGVVMRENGMNQGTAGCRKSMLGFLVVMSLSAVWSVRSAAEVVRPSAVQAWEQTGALPAAKQGAFPIHMPKYEGVKQLLLISNKWVIVVTENMEEVFDKINELSKGEFKKACVGWVESCKPGKPRNWQHYHGRAKIRNKFIAEAREAVGEREYDRPDYYTITSTDDGNYADGKRAGRATRIFVSLGSDSKSDGRSAMRLETKYPSGLPEAISWMIYSYVEFPSAMQQGKTYTIALKNKKKVTFVYDEYRHVSRAIKVNQVGYLPDAGQKFAYLGCYLYEFGPLDCSANKAFKVVDVKSGEVVHAGELKLREKNPRFTPAKKEQDPAKRPLLYGEDVYEMDLGPLRKEGDFFITVPGVGRSWTFRHAGDAYGEAFYIAARHFYHQRCGIEIKEPYSAWPRIKCHTEPVYECDWVGGFKGAPKNWKPFNVFACPDKTRKTENAWGGWHDAADWDRNSSHYTSAFDLMVAYELAPKKFTDGQLNIPESGNGVPDILDEAWFGLEIWRKSQDERGGVSSYVETSTHPGLTAKVDYSFARRTRGATMLFAGAAAQLARLTKPFDQARARQYQEAALKAYAYAINEENNIPAGTKLKYRLNRGKGKEMTAIYPGEKVGTGYYEYQLVAMQHLYLLTKDAKYLEGLEDVAGKCRTPLKYPLGVTRGRSIWFYQGLVMNRDKAFPEALRKKWEAWYATTAETWVDQIAEMPYRMTWPRHQDFWAAWGNLCMTNYNRTLWMAFRGTGDAKFRDAVCLNADVMFGANAMGMSWTSGMGYVYPIDFQHEVSGKDDILDPVPGTTLYGLTGGAMNYYKFRQNVWDSPLPEGKKRAAFQKEENRYVPWFRRFSVHPGQNVGQNEFTHHETSSSTMFTAAMLMPEGWMPSEELKKRKPRQEASLFGLYYLP